MQRRQNHAHNRLRGTLSVLAAAVAAMAPLTAAGRQVDPAEGLATVFERRAREVLSSPVPMVPEMEMAIVLAQEAAELQPDDVELLRALAAIAGLAERTDLQQDIITRLAALDRADSWIRLRRINEALSKYQAAPELIEAYQSLLKEENVARLGAPVASRLANDLALVYERMGETALFAEWVGRASALDSSNKAAAATVAGFYHVHGADPYGKAELLVNLLMADPADTTTQATLGRHLLNQGAFRGAERMYRLVRDSHEVLRESPSNELLADLAIAQWGAGNANAALETIRTRQRELNYVAQMVATRENPDLTIAERSQVSAPLPTTLAAVRLAILDTEGQIEEMGPALERFFSLVDALVEQNPDTAPAQKHEMLSLAAWIGAWFGADAQKIESLLERAEQHAAFDEEVRERFAGWLALRRGELDRAAEIFGGFDSADSAALLGVALVNFEQGNTRDAAKALLELYRQQPGTAQGIWARERLARLIEKQIPSTNLATRLEDLLDTVPRVIDRIPTNPSRALTVRIEPTKPNFTPYEPVLVRLTLTNNAHFPLGISPAGPILPRVLIEPQLTVAALPGLSKLPAIVVDVGRRLRLEPGERLEVLVDLRRYAFGRVLDAVAIDGASLTLRATLNFRIVAGETVHPGLLGSSSTSRIFRVNGVTLTDTWIQSSLDAIADPDEPDDIVRMALLGNAIARGKAALPEGVGELIEAAKTPLLEAFGRLDPAAQAWLVAVSPPGAEGLEPLYQVARSSESPLVQMSYLVVHATDPADPMIEAAARSDDPTLRRLGELYTQVAQLRQQQGASAPPPQQR